MPWIREEEWVEAKIRDLRKELEFLKGRITYIEGLLTVLTGGKSDEREEARKD